MNNTSNTQQVEEQVKKKTFSFFYIFIIVIGVAILGVVFYSVYLMRDTVSNGADELKDVYNLTKDAEIEKWEEKYHDDYYDMAEKKYHVKTVANINVIDEQEISNLEVLQVSDVEYFTENKDDNEYKITFWAKYTATGVYYVDLMQAEYIVDNNHNTVTVRLPEPKIDKFSIDDEILFKKDDAFDDNYSVGDNFAENKRKEAYSKLEERIRSNQELFTSAKKQTEIIVSNWIKTLNPDRADLTVFVEFVK